MPLGTGTAPSRRTGMLANRKLSYQTYGVLGGVRGGVLGAVLALLPARALQEIAYHWLAQPVLMVLVDCSARFTVAGSEL